MGQQFYLVTFFVLTSIIQVSAQFNTISMEVSQTVIEPDWDIIDKNRREHNEFFDFFPTDSTLVEGLTEKQRKQLYLQLIYYDNEINERMIELFNMEMTREASHIKPSDSNQYIYETEIDSSVRGVYRLRDELTLESVLAEILKNNLAHPRIVLAQAVLETGWFKSSVCRNYNNLFGLTNPRTKEYYRFETWQDSVKAYYTKVQYRYNSGNYLRWLQEIGYAEDPDYTAKLRLLLDGPLQTFLQ